MVISEPRVMKYQIGDMPYEILQVTQKLLSFPRSSPHAMVMFTNFPYQKNDLQSFHPLRLSNSHKYTVVIHSRGSKNLILAMNLLQLLLSCSYDFLVMILSQTLGIFMVNVSCFVVYQAFGLILIIMQFQTFIDIVRHFHPFFLLNHIFSQYASLVQWCITRTLISQINICREETEQVLSYL